MSLTLQEALALLQSRGPATMDRLHKLEQAGAATVEQLDEAEAELARFRELLEQEQQALIHEAEGLTRALQECKGRLEQQLGNSEASLQSLVAWLQTRRGELESELGATWKQFEEVESRLDQIPPLFGQAIENQRAVLQQSQGKVHATLDNLEESVTRATAEFSLLKEGVGRNQEVITRQVETLLQHVLKVQAESQTQGDFLSESSSKVVSSFESQLGQVFATTVDVPGQRIKAGLEATHRWADQEVRKQMRSLLDNVLGKMLKALLKVKEDNDSIIADLRRLVPERLSQGAHSLSYVILNLDIILRALARKGVEGAKNFLKQGLDWLSSLTGLKLDFVKQAVDLVGNVVQVGVNIGTAPLALARSLLTDPSRLGSDLQQIVLGSQQTALAAGRTVGL